MIDQLTPAERLRLMRFVCSFAWADFEIQPEERAFIGRLIRGLDLGPEEELQVHRWLDVPPSLEGLDPATIPAAHRQLFLEAVEGVIAADGAVAEEEAENIAVFRQLLI